MIKLPDELTPKAASRAYGGQVEGYHDGWNACLSEVQRLNATAQPLSDGWVKCSERMPIDIDEVRAYKSIEVLATDGQVVTAIDCIAGIPMGKREEFWCTFSTYGNINPKEITHWMPLPAAPGGQDD